MAEISANNTGLSGEYFVAAELYRRGWSVGMTIGNAKAVDIFAEKNDKKIAVQVKSIFKKSHSGWPMMTDRIKSACYYIFVILNGDKMLPPEFFIATSDEVCSLIKQYPTRGIVTVTSVRSDQYRERWDKLEEVKNVNIQVVSLEKLEPVSLNER